MFTLSVCLIVKDEEEVLERCLNCVSQFADEIVVIDTGSKDKTVEIAKRFTNCVHSFQWENDFSKARNFSFSKATKDYVMWLDADDIITHDNIEKIKKLKQTSEPKDVYMLKYEIAFDEANNPTFTYFRERILRRSMNFKWEGFVHEVITPRGKIDHVDIAIQHRKIKSSNPKRNLKIYNQKIKEGHKLNPREQFYYARELFYNNYNRKCIKTLKRYLKNKEAFIVNKIDAHKIIAQCFMRLGDNENAKKHLIESFKLAPPSAEFCCMLGNLEIEKNLKGAMFWFKAALCCEKETESGAFVEDSYYDLIPNIQLCYINYKLGNIFESYNYHKKAMEINPKNQAVINNEKYFKSLKF